MKVLTPEEIDRQLAHIREAMAECDRAHTATELHDARKRLDEYLREHVDSMTQVQQMQLLAGPKE